MIWYRVGGKLKRTIYMCTDENPEGQFVGLMDDPELAERICVVLTAWEKLPKQGDSSE